MSEKDVTRIVEGLNQEDRKTILKAMSRDLEVVGKRAEEAGGALGKFFSLGSRASQMSDEWMKVSTAFDDLTGNIDASKTAIDSLSAGGIKKIAGSFPGAKAAAGFLKGTLAAKAALEGLAAGALGMAKGLTDLFDKPSKDMRMFDNQMYDVERRFGGAHKEAIKFADALKMETSSQFARGMHMTRDEMAGMVSATRGTSLSLEQLNKSVDTGVGVTKLYAVASAQASAMNISQSQAADLLNTAMNKQGKSAQDAAEMMGSFSGIAEKTGLTTQTVARTLNGAIQGFEQLGLAADFGRPILEGFGSVMDNMCLGIEIATQ